MNFLYPLGLIGLIGVPIIIVIYILRNKYVEKTVSSIYLWKLSEKFLKKKRPLKKITDIISLVLQILTIVILSLAIAHPVFNVKDSAENICFVLDVSGSMNIKDGEVTRFDKAKDKIKDLVNQVVSGSTYTLITSSDQTKIILEKESDKNLFLKKLDEVNLTYTTGDLLEALNLVQNYYNEQSVSHAYLLTDKNYQEVENIELINFSNHVDNYALFNSSYQVKQGKVNVYSNIVSYENDAEINVNLYLDDQLKESKSFDVNQMVEKAISFSFDEVNFSSLKLEITNEDALDDDNYNILYSKEEKNQSSILLVSSSPFYLNSILNAIGNVKINNVTSYKNEVGYDLYIFDSYSPLNLPNDGSVWIINSTKNIPSSGFVVQNEVELAEGGQMEYSNDKSSLYSELTKDIKNNKITLNKYVRYGLYREFTSILNIDRNPMIFVGNNDYGNREIVFSFDFHNSDFPLLYDYIVLMRNFLNYSSPLSVENLFYTVGDSLKVNILKSTTSVKVEAPSHKVSFLSTDFNEASMVLDEVGTYLVSVNTSEGSKMYSIYVEFNKEEGKVTINEDKINLVNNQGQIKFDGIYDNLSIVIIIGAILFILDWMWYCYEH